MTRLGILGGSFDPVHAGHLYVARAARDAFRLERVFLMPASQPPHKLTSRLTSAAHRLAMVRLAIEGDPTLAVLTDEIDRGGTSYTFHTVTSLRPKLGEGAELFFIIGSDSLRELPTWFEYRKLVHLVTLITIARREGEAAGALASLRGLVDTTALERLAQHILELPPHPASSTDIRRRLAAGESVGHLVPEKVAAYIVTHGLYRS
ncbi:MAG: nicotinate-nucleotide adenylyltransferase [Planctomycetota bacterium]